MEAIENKRRAQQTTWTLPPLRLAQSIFNTQRPLWYRDDEGAREKGLQSFQDYVRSSLASGNSDDSETFWEEIISKVLLPLTMMSDTPQEKLVAIAAINKLLLSPSDDAHPTSAPASDSPNPSATSNPSAQRLLYRLLRYLKNLLPDPNLQFMANEPLQVMEGASATYGTIFKIGGQTLAETVGEIEIQQAVRWMSETGGEWSGSATRASTLAQISNANANNPAVAQPQQKKVEKEKILAAHARIAGVLILTQIAIHSPDLFYQNIELILSRIMYPLRDPSRFYVYTGSLGSALVGKEVKDGAKDGAAIERSKPAYEARDVVRRIAARLFRVTLAVIALRESSPEGVDTSEAPNKMSSSGVPALRGSNWKLDRIASQPLITPGSNASGATKTNKPLMKVAAAASNDITNFILSSSSSIDKDFIQSPHYQRIVQSQRHHSATGSHGSKSQPPQPVQGDINRAFGALLIYRELFDTKMASLAGVIATDPSERRRSYFGTAAMDDEHMRDLMGDALDMRRHSMAGPAA
ncbi:7162_t:CDS:2, partial [Acaulospora colombiana]